MFDLICKNFIKDYDKYEDNNVRQRYGIVFSIFSIICNIILVIFKLIIAAITNSVSIRADGFNNMSDIGSNLATLFGFALSNKHPDSDHPYGFGRMEYISGMIVAFLILLMGFESLKESIGKIINPGEYSFSSIGIVVLIISILIKLVMYLMNGKAGKKINSESLKAAGQDSLNDSLVTCSSMLSLLLFRFFNINIDAYVGTIVAILVLKSGIEIFLGVMNTILGQAPDKQLIHKIEDDIMSHEVSLGIHDLIMHDYGPSHRFLTLHVEVDASKDIMDIHDKIDNIEMEILNNYGILTTIHMDPVDTKDELVVALKQKVIEIITEFDKEFMIHDFRMVKGETHSNLVFDVVVPSEDRRTHEQIKKSIDTQIKNKLGKQYNCVINIDHPFA